MWKETVFGSLYIKITFIASLPYSQVKISSLYSSVVAISEEELTENEAVVILMWRWLSVERHCLHFIADDPDRRWE